MFGVGNSTQSPLAKGRWVGSLGLPNVRYTVSLTANIIDNKIYLVQVGFALYRDMKG